MPRKSTWQVISLLNNPSLISLSHKTLEVGFEDGSKVIARKILPKNGADLGDRFQKLGIEARLLKWLAESTNIPVPRILSPLDVQDCNIIIMDKLLGTMLLNMYGALDTSAKARPNFLNFVLSLEYSSFRSGLLRRMLLSLWIYLGWMYHNVSVHWFLIYCRDPSTSLLCV